MIRQRFAVIIKDPTWLKISTFSLAIFFITLADALISFWAPNILEDSLHSSVLMGVIISFQSVIGLGADLIFPKLLKFARVRRLIVLSIITCLLTLLALSAASAKPIVLMFLVAMATWGVYYELIGFAQYQFVADSVPAPSRSGAWGVIGVFRNLAYFLGPMLAAALLFRNNLTLVAVIVILLFLAYLVISSTKKSRENSIELTASKMNVFEELSHWLTLSKRVWPMIIVSFLMGAIDATFWTTGAVMTEKMAHVNPLGSLFLPLYAAPSLITGFFVAKLAVTRGKKKLAEIFLLLSGIPLMIIGVSANIYWLLSVVFVSSLLLGFSYPFAEGVYSDIDVRLGCEKKHMIGLTGSVINLSYIIWPIVAGIVTQQLGEMMTFTVIGVMTVIGASILLAITPKKLKLPQTQISTWKD